MFINLMATLFKKMSDELKIFDSSSFFNAVSLLRIKTYYIFELSLIIDYKEMVFFLEPQF